MLDVLLHSDTFTHLYYVMLFSSFRLNNHNHCSIHTSNLRRHICFQSFHVCFIKLLLRFLMSHHFSLWRIFLEYHNSSEASVRLSFSVWQQFTFALLGFLYLCHFWIFPDSVFYSVWILTFYTEIHNCICSVCSSSVSAGIITCYFIVYFYSLCTLQCVGL